MSQAPRISRRFLHPFKSASPFHLDQASYRLMSGPQVTRNAYVMHLCNPPRYSFFFKRSNPWAIACQVDDGLPVNNVSLTQTMCAGSRRGWLTCLSHDQCWGQTRWNAEKESSQLGIWQILRHEGQASHEPLYYQHAKFIKVALISRHAWAHQGLNMSCTNQSSRVAWIFVTSGSSHSSANDFSSLLALVQEHNARKVYSAQTPHTVQVAYTTSNFLCLLLQVAREFVPSLQAKIRTFGGAQQHQMSYESSRHPSRCPLPMIVSAL